MVCFCVAIVAVWAKHRITHDPCSDVVNDFYLFLIFCSISLLTI
jgi:hypothetical protein